MEATASGRPAPRYSPTGTVDVTTERPRAATFGIRYAPGSIVFVVAGRYAAPG